MVAAAAASYSVWRARTLGPFTGDWGPLAVSQTAVGGDLVRVEGTIRQTDYCLVLEVASGDEYLLVWWKGNTRWDATNKLARYQGVDGWIREVRSGSAVVLSGSGELFTSAEGSLEAVPWDAWVARFEWAAAPSPDCGVVGAWVVSDVGG